MNQAHYIVRYFLLLTSVLFISCSYNASPDPTEKDYAEELREYRQKKNREFRDTTTSPFSKADIKHFEKLNYYDIKEEYVVWAQFERIEPGEPFVMPTTGSKTPYYIRYGKLRFEIKGDAEQLTVYRNIGHDDTEQYRDYLFIPFKDLTNGETTYSGGRYLELHMPIYNGQLVKLDFNRAYNPFCVYNFDEYDCPIPPEANHLQIPIKAGEKMYTMEDSSQSVAIQ